VSAPVVDSHCHLDFPQYTDELEAVIARANSAGVGLMVTICTRVKDFARVLAIAEAHDNVFCSVGTHPHNAAEEPEVTADELVRLAAHPKVVGIGEAGLDYHYDNSPRAAQRASFLVHIAAARESGLPLIIHTRDADADTAAILEAEMAKGAFPAVLHCYTGGPELARKGVALGLYVSFSGIITFRKADALREIAAGVPDDRLLVETDAPFLAPEPHRGERNEPAFVVHTLARLAGLREVDEAALARQTSDNFFRLFSRVPRPPVYGVRAA